jgi:hypothetical protein
MEARFIRGKDPKEAMGLGLGPDFKALDKMARRFGFEQTYEPTHPDATVTWYKPGKGNVHYVHGGSPFFWDTTSADPKKWYVVIEPEETGERYPEEVYIWKEPAKWRRVFDLNESINFERGKDPKEAMGIGRKRDRKALDLVKGDLIEAFSSREDRWIWVEALEEKPANNWSKQYGDNFDIKVKILDPDYHNHFYGDDFEMIRIFIDSFDTWELLEKR